MGAQDFRSKPPKVLSLTTATAIAIPVNEAPIFVVGPGSDITFTPSGPGKPDERITLIVDTIDTNSRTLTFGTGFRSTGTLATGGSASRRFVLVFMSDGMTWTEQSRTAAQA